MSAPNETEPADGQALPRTSLWATLSRFSLVGVAATLTYFVVANLLMMATAMEPAFASVLAYLAGMVVSFMGQSRLTFMVKAHSWRHLAKFCVMSAAGLAISWLSVVAVQAAGQPPFWATVVTSVAIPALSFVVMKLWVFAPETIPTANTIPK